MKHLTLGSCVSALFFASTLAACTTAIAPPPTGIAVDKDVALPVTVEKVWYGTDKVRLLGLAYEESGVLTVTDAFAEFVHEKGSLRIAGGSIHRVVWGKLSPDIANDWVIVHYTDSGQSSVAAFKGAPFSGGRKDTKIYSAVLRIMKPR
jgi:hypothetical protein